MPWWNRLRRRRPLDQQLDAELRFHVEKLTETHLAAGVPPEEARRRALIEFGGTEQVKEDVRDVRRTVILDHMAANLKAAFRFLRTAPAFSATLILTLALGIGANSAVFSVIDAVLLRPLPFPDGDRLMRLQQRNVRSNAAAGFVAPVRLEEWNRLSRTFQAITGHYLENASETSGTLPEKVTRAWVAPRFLAVWGVPPALGRGFTAAEERFGGPNAVLISDRFWRLRFGADPGVTGKTLRFGRSAWPIVGVMPAWFQFPEREVDLWSPSPVDAPFAQSRESTWFTTIGRLRPGVTVEQARADLATVQASLGREHPPTDATLAVEIEPLKETIVGGVRRSLWLLFGSVSLLLLIACTNIAALLLARATQRQQEISIRLSLGASRAVIASQLLTEALVLAIIGAVAGLGLAGVSAAVLRTMTESLPRREEIGVDGRLVLYAMGCAVVVTLLCGLLPALHSTRRDLSGALAQGSRSQVGGRHRLQWLLVGVQVALAVTLLAGAGLLLRSFEALGRVAPGFDASHVLTLHVSGSWGETTDRKALTQRIDRTLDAVRAVPGVEAAATAAALPGVPASYPAEFTVVERRDVADGKIVAENRVVSAGYFATLRIPVLAGEPCRETAGPAGVVVNRSFVNTYLEGRPALGYHVETRGNASFAPGEIRAVVGDARESGIHRDAGPVVYWCFSAPVPDPFYLIRTRAEPMAMAEVIRRRIREVEPGRSVFDIKPLERHLGDAFAQNRLRTVLLTFFALTAVSLACIGLYGTLSYLVNVRQREVGLRLALGALRRQIVGQFLRQGLGVALAGCLAGLALGAGFARLLSGMLFGVSPSDPATLLGVVALVLAVAAVASLLPAVRAARMEPVEVLREK